MKDIKFTFHLRNGQTYDVHATDLEAAIFHFFFYYRNFRLELAKVVSEGRTYEGVGAAVSWKIAEK